MNVSTPAIILRTINYLESSKIIYAYTKDFGKQTLVAKGARRSKSKFGSTLEICSLVELKYYKRTNREMYNLTDADFVKGNFLDKLDFTDKILCLMLCESILKLDKDDNPDEFFYEQLEKLINISSIEKVFNSNMFIYSQLELAKSIGHSVYIRWHSSDIVDYAIDREVFLDISNCKLYLDNNNFSRNRLKFTVGELNLIKEIANGNLEISIDNTQLKKYVHFFESFFSFHTDSKFCYNSFELIGS